MTEDIIENSNKVVEKGDAVSVHYVGKLDDGTVFDTSEKEEAMEAGIYNEMRDYEPLKFTVGAGQMIKGFDEGVVGMKAGEEKILKIPPEEAYGEYVEEYARELPRDAVDFVPEVGMQLATETGLRGTVTEVGEGNFVFDYYYSTCSQDHLNLK